MIYFIQSNKDAIKIGYTKNELTFKTRLINLRPSNSGTLTILNLISGGPHLEKAIQKEFSFCQIRGEWFNPTEKLLLFIKNPQCGQLKNSFNTKKNNYSKNNNNCKQCGYEWYGITRFKTICPWCASEWSKEESSKSKQPKTESQKINKFEYIINNNKFKAITKTNKPKIKID